jgi:outer membrane protein assembly factor BamB
VSNSVLAQTSYIIEEETMLKSCVVAACLVMLFAGICAAQAGGVLWTARYMEDQSGWAETLSCMGNRLYAAGQTWPRNELFRERSAFTAYDTKTGTPIWTESGAEGTSAKAVKAVPGRVYATGTEKRSEQYPMFAKALNAANGNTVWERSWPESGSMIPSSLVLDAYATRAFVAGTRIDPGEEEGFFSVLALNTTKGAMIWEKSKEGTEARKGNAMAMTFNSGRIFTAGMFYDKANFRDGFAVRAYTPAGRLLWEDVQWSDGVGTESTRLRSYATAVTATFNRVYVAGSIHNKAGGNAFSIRAYDAATGRLIWEDRYNGYKYFHDAAYSVLLQGPRVFVGGFVTRPSSGRAYTVRAYDAAKGNLLWSSMEGGYNIEENGVSALAALQTTIYGAGTALDGSALTVRAYEAQTGQIIWENFLPQEGVVGGFGDAFAACTSAGSLFSAGAAMVGDDGYAYTVRAYTAR